MWYLYYDEVSENFNYYCCIRNSNQLHNHNMDRKIKTKFYTIAKNSQILAWADVCLVFLETILLSSFVYLLGFQIRLVSPSLPLGQVCKRLLWVFGCSFANQPFLLLRLWVLGPAAQRAVGSSSALWGHSWCICSLSPKCVS